MVKISAQKMQSMKASGVIEQFSILSNVTKLVQEFRVQCEEIEYRKDRSAASRFHSYIHCSISLKASAESAEMIS